MKKRNLHRGVVLSTFFKLIADNAIEKLERYKKLYGELPVEEPESESQDALQNE